MPKSRNNPLFKVGDVLEVNAETGEAVPIEGAGLRMLPGLPGTCEWCYTMHAPHLPHNQQSLAYQMKFSTINGRAATWTDAMAHCSPEVRAIWKERLVEMLKHLGQPIPDDLK